MLEPRAGHRENRGVILLIGFVIAPKSAAGAGAVTHMTDLMT